MTTPAETLIHEITAGYQEVVQFWQGISPAELSRPVLPDGWSVKDMVGHFAAWNWRCAGLLSEVPISKAPLKATPEEVALNQEYYEERKPWSWEEIEADFRASYQALVKAIEQIPPAQLADPEIRQAILYETRDHYRRHLPALREWRMQVLNAPTYTGG